MRRILPVFTLLFLLAEPILADDLIFPDGTPAKNLGGLVIVRNGDQTTISLGGILFARKVKVTTATPEGKVVTRFVLPSVFHTPEPLPYLDLAPFSRPAPAMLAIEIPDIYGLIYIEGELVRARGISRNFESPPLQPGKEYPVKLRAVFAVGDRLMIEDKAIGLRAGATIAVTFDGTRALAVPLPLRELP